MHLLLGEHAGEERGIVLAILMARTDLQMILELSGVVAPQAARRSLREISHELSDHCTSRISDDPAILLAVDSPAATFVFLLENHELLVHELSLDPLDVLFLLLLGPCRQTVN